MPNQIKGRILSIGNIQNIATRTGSTFQKRELILDASTYDQFTGVKRENYPSFSFLQRHCESLDNFHIGQSVIISFFISGRRYEKDGIEKYFNEVVAYKIEPFGSIQNPAAAGHTGYTHQGAAPLPQTATELPKTASDDDLPF